MPPRTLIPGEIPPAATRTTVEINGFALREIRVRSGLAVAELAAQVDALVRNDGSQKGMTRSYFAKIELGHSERVSPKVFAAILKALSITDRRTLLANPHASEPIEAVA
jgi:transcriptional regulator with XRE-family HTH domain